MDREKGSFYGTGNNRVSGKAGKTISREAEVIKLLQISELMDTSTLHDFNNSIIGELKKISNNPGCFKKFRLFFIALMDDQKTR